MTKSEREHYVDKLLQLVGPRRGNRGIITQAVEKVATEAGVSIRTGWNWWKRAEAKVAAAFADAVEYRREAFYTESAKYEEASKNVMERLRARDATATADQSVAASALDRMAKLGGLYEPERGELTVKDAKPGYEQVLDALAEESPETGADAEGGVGGGEDGETPLEAQ